MNEGVFQRIAVYTGGVLSVAAIMAVFTMWNQLNRIEAQEPLREQLRAIENEQMRQGVQLNSNEIDIINMEIRDLEDRVDALERRP